MQLTDNVELLRRILETQQARTVSYEEAAEIGESLITFYETLGEEAQDDE